MAIAACAAHVFPGLCTPDAAWAGNGVDAPGCVSQGLGDIALIPTSQRPKLSATDREFWSRYKNDARFAAWIDERAAQRGVQGYREILGEIELGDSYPNPRAAQARKTANQEARKNANRVKSWLKDYDRLPAGERARIRPRPATLDLHHPCNDNKCGTSVLQDSDWFPGGAAELELTGYQKAVLHLRQGDTVRSGGREWILGRFLGAGNATHVWEIEGKPGKVLRLPFLSSQLFGMGIRTTPTLERARQLMAPLRRPPKLPGLKRVTVEKIGDLNEYAVVSRIDGDLNAFDFQEQNQAFIRTLRSKRETDGRFDIHEIARKHRLTQAEAKLLVEQHDKLERAMSIIDDPKNLRATASYDLHERQLVWDKTERDWILAEW